MKFETYNNIGISLIAFLSIIKKVNRKVNRIEYSKSLLIIPLVLHDPLIKYLKDSRVIVKGIEDLLLSKVEHFLNYSDRYINYLPLSINIIIFAEKMGFIELKDNGIVPILSKIEKIDFNDKELGDREMDINKASKNIATILNEDVKELYFKLRIEL